MKRIFAVLLAILACLTAGALAQSPTDLNAGSQVAYSGSTGSYTLSWWGTGGYTYLIETSDDLVNWSYLPVVETGSDAIIQWGFTSTSSCLFLKLEYITVPASDLSGSVFNGPDNNGNGIPDDWELFYFGHLGVDPNADPNGEGFTNLQDYENGNNPIINQTVSVGPCVGEYLFHETSGTIAHDISSLHNNGVLSGSAGWETGGYDGLGAVTFDGTSSQVLISDSGNVVLPAGGAPFSLSFWFQPSSAITGTTTLMSAGVSGTTGFQLYVNSTTSPPNLVLLTSGSNKINLAAPFQTPGWTQAAVTYDGTTAIMYLNGVQQASGTGTLVSDTSAIILGNGFNGDHSFAGAIENLTLYQAVLGSWDVESLYDISTTATGADSSGIPNWWKYQYFGTLNVDPTAFVSWSGSQMTILDAYNSGINPVDFYNGQTPQLVIVSGSGLTGSPNQLIPAPLIVSVTDTNGNPLANAPVTFIVNSGTGTLQASSAGGAASTVTVLTNASGIAQVFYKLPNVPNGSSQIVAEAGPSGSMAQVLFTEAADSGAGTYGSPFVPSNVAGTINPDGSETVTWQNNDTQSPIYIYLGAGTWSVTGTLPAGTTSYGVSATVSGTIEIGNNYTPGGSTGMAPGGADPGILPNIQLPPQSYAVVDLSGSAATSDVTFVALDDSNNAAFAYESNSNTLQVDTWTNGTLGNMQSLTLDTGAEYDTGEDGEVYQTVNLNPSVLLPDGTVYGRSEMSYDYDYWGQQSSFVVGFISTAGDPNFIVADSDIIFDPFGEDYGIFSSTTLIQGATNNGYAGNGRTAYSHGTPFAYVTSGTTTTYFTQTSSTSVPPAWLPGGTTQYGPGYLFDLLGVNDQGWLIFNNEASNGTVTNQLWNGTSLTVLPIYPTAINHQDVVVGDLADTYGNQTGAAEIWQSGTSGTGGIMAFSSIPGPMPLQQLLTQIGNVYPALISNANLSDSSTRVLFTDVYNADYLLTLSSSNSLSQVSAIQLPVGVSIAQYNNVNAAGVISAIGQPTSTSTTNHALLLVPVQFIITRPNAPDSAVALNPNVRTAPTNTVPRDEIVDVEISVPPVTNQNLTVQLDLAPVAMKTQVLGARGSVQMYDFGQLQSSGSTQTDITQITLSASNSWQEHFKAVFNREGTVNLKIAFAIGTSGTDTIVSQNIAVTKQIREYGYDNSGYNFNQYDEAFQTAYDYWGGFYSYPIDDVDRLKAMGMDESSLGQTLAYPGGADDIMSYGWTLDPDIHVLHNDPTYVDENGVTQAVPPEREYVPSLGASRQIYYPAAATTPPATAIYWATCELYHKAQVFDGSGNFRFWRSWDSATTKYNGGGVNDYLTRVHRVMLEGETPDGRSYLWPIETDFSARSP